MFMGILCTPGWYAKNCGAHTVSTQTPDSSSPRPTLMLVIGGVMMGLANLVPGISGGTMLVATGVYDRFIAAVAAASRLRLSRQVVIDLAIVVCSAGAAIGLGAGVIAIGLAEFRWGMYSLFIGLTLGGVPLLWRLVRPLSAGAATGFVLGFIGMAFIAWVQSREAGAGLTTTPLTLGLGGAAAASAMILPGVSGAYLLLLLGQYRPVVEAVKDTMSAAINLDVGGFLDQMKLVLPIGIGVILGIAVVSNVLTILIRRAPRLTHGVLLGLLVGAPLGLYPFRAAEQPSVGDEIRGEFVTAEMIAEMDPADWPEQTFRPDTAQILISLGLVFVGGGVTLALAQLGDRHRDQEDG